MNLINRQKQFTNIHTPSHLMCATPKTAQYLGSVQNEDIFRDTCSLGTLQVLINMGLKEKAPLAKNLASLATAIGIIDQYQQLFEAIISQLKTAGYLAEESGKIVVATKAKQGLSTFDWDKAVVSIHQKTDEYIAHLALAQRCLAAFQNILTGQQRATDVIFPEGKLDHVSPIYKGNYRANYFNDLLGDIISHSVATGIQQLQPGDKIRLLEVGAGTGGTSEVLFHKLAPYQDHIEYTYTDVSKSFLINAEQKFMGIAPYLATALFDIEQPARKQGIPMGKFDIVIGANVVHATKDIANTLHHIKFALKKNGLLVLNELAETELFTTLTFGLLEGWWLYQDKDIRLEGSPGLSPENWQLVLQETGFNDPTSYPAQPGLPQQIITAQSNGLVLENTPTPTEPAMPDTVATQSEVAHQISNKTQQNDNNAELTEKVIAIAADTIKLPKAGFSAKKQFSDYGFDSILGLSLIKNLNKTLNIDLAPTDIFNYPNVTQMVAHIGKAYPASLHTDNGAESVNETPNHQEIAQEVPTSTIPQPTSGIAPTHYPTKASREDIAIIGMSGQYGRANNLDEFWEALRSGTSLIEEVPDNRWDKNSTLQCKTWHS